MPAPVDSVSTPSIDEPRRQLLERAMRAAVARAVVDIRERRCRRDVFALERRMNVGCRELLAGLVGDRLHDLAELDLQQARQRQAVVALEQVRDAALARLAVDADDGLVGAADVGGIDRQVRHVPCMLPALPRRAARRAPS